MSDPGAEIVAVGMATSLGLDAGGTAAASRARLNRFRESSVRGRRGPPIIMALVPDRELPPLAPALAASTARRLVRRERMLKLAAVALGEALAREPDVASVPVLLGAPAAHPGLNPPADEGLLDELSVQSGLPFARDRSAIFPGGRAAGFLALKEALGRIAGGAAGCVAVGGVDSPVDLRLLSTLDEERRLRAHGVLDGFIPGEAAAFVLLAASGTGRPPLARVLGAAVAEEPGHRYAEAIYRGDGLSAALRLLFEAAPPASPVETVYVGLNGEGLGGKEWGVAHIRNHDRFARRARIEQPSHTLGDVGAALAPVMLALAAIGLHQGYRRGPCLAWASSDLAERGAALLDRAG